MPNNRSRKPCNHSHKPLDEKIEDFTTALPTVWLLASPFIRLPVDIEESPQNFESNHAHNQGPPRAPAKAKILAWLSKEGIQMRSKARRCCTARSTAYLPHLLCVWILCAGRSR